MNVERQRNPDLSGNFEATIQAFRQHLKAHHFANETIQRYSRMLLYFLEWKDMENITEITYHDLLAFIRHCQHQGKSTVRINKYLLTIRHYLDHQVRQGKATANPATGLQIRGAQQNIIKGLLSRKELDELYREYKGKHKLILSLAVHQGLTVRELEKLEPTHLDLHSGTIYIPSGKKSNSRTLKLEAHQIMELMKAKENGKDKLVNNKPLRNTGHQLCKKLQLINPKVKNLRQLRASVISHWLKTDNLRQVQYKAGHKHVMSTEKYLQEHLEGLKEQLKRYHPLK